MLIDCGGANVWSPRDLYLHCRLNWVIGFSSLLLVGCGQDPANLVSLSSQPLVSPLLVSPLHSEQLVATGIVRSGLVQLSAPVTGYAAHYRLDIEDPVSLPSISAQGAVLTPLGTVIPGYTSYGVTMESAFELWSSLESLELTGLEGHQVQMVAVLPEISETTALVFQGDPTTVTVADAALLLATLQSQSTDPETLITRANALLGGEIIVDVDPVPSRRCGNYVATGGTSIDLMDVAAILARLQTSSDPTAIAQRINQLLAVESLTAAQVVGIPGETLPCLTPAQVKGQLSLTDPDNPTRTGSFQDDYQLTEIPATQSLLINVDSTEFDPFLQIIDTETGSVVAFNDNSTPGLTFNSQVVLEPDPGSTLLARVTSFNAQETGSYTLTTRLLESSAGSLVGTVWNDANATGLRELMESGIPDWTVFLDSNGNGVQDDAEPATLTDSVGRYVFSSLNPGTYTLAQALPPGWLQTLPTSTIAQSTEGSAAEASAQDWILGDDHQSAITRPSAGRIVVAGSDPNDYVVEPGQGFDGVVRLRLPRLNSPSTVSRCTGSLLPTGRHILTAAHCLTNTSGAIDIQTPTAIFDLPGGEVTRLATTIFVHPSWPGAPATASADLAILELATPAPPEADRYAIYRGSNEVNQVFTKVGYGRIGTGVSGDSDPNSGDLKLAGLNQVDALNTVLINAGVSAGIPDTQLIYDFDNGTEANDAFGIIFQIEDLGLGVDEVNIGAGDSGGPAFINGQIAGVSSYSLRLTLRGRPSPDITPFIDSSFGEFAGDTRIAAYADWVDGILSQTNGYQVTIQDDEVLTRDFGNLFVDP